MRYILYARKSSEEKKRQVQSIEDQICDLKPLIERGNLNVVDKLTESSSAKEPGRPIFNRMLERIQKGEADAILCWHLNRLTRNEIDSGTIRWMLRQGIIREIVTPTRTYRPEDNALITALESAMGEQFIVELKTSTRRGVLSKIEKGWFPGHVPQGYKNDVIANTVVRDPDRWDLIRKAWTEMLTGQYSVPVLAEKMTKEWGYKSPRGGKGMPRNTLYRILSNPFYTGVFLFEDRVYPGKHEPMVTHAEFQAVQQLLNRIQIKPSRTTRAYSYNGLIVCGHCGRAVCADRKRKILKGTGEERFYTYYACCRGSKCNRYRVREDTIDAEIGERLSGITMPLTYLDYARLVAQRHLEEEQAAEKTVRESQERFLDDIERRLDGLIEMRAKGVIGDAEFDRLRTKWKDEQLSMLANREKTLRASEAACEATVGVAEYCVNAEQVFMNGSIAEKGLIARQLGVSYTLTKGQLVIEEHELLGLVRDHNKNAASPPASLEPVATGSESGETDVMPSVCEGWGELLNKSRTLAEVRGSVFPGTASLANPIQ